MPAALGPELVQTKLDVLLSFCQRFSPRPRLVVAGLNPHAGEAGQLGREELEWLNACLEDWRECHPNVTLQGPTATGHLLAGRRQRLARPWPRCRWLSGPIPRSGLDPREAAGL